jgi:FtsH-binding integral membrane protein
MYLSAKKYPEFLGKDRKYMLAALKYCISKSGHGFIFWVVLLVLVAVFITWSYWLEPLVFGKTAGLHNMIGSVVFGVLFWLYLLIDINTITRQAVIRYIRDFEIEQERT